jgi:hypothetical protein
MNISPSRVPSVNLTSPTSFGISHVVSSSPSLLMQLAAPHQAPGDVGHLQRRAFGR